MVEKNRLSLRQQIPRVGISGCVNYFAGHGHRIIDRIDIRLPSAPRRGEKTERGFIIDHSMLYRMG